MDFVFPLRQHVGAPSEALVQENDFVKRGQIIAGKPQGALGTNIFSSVDGRVKTVDTNQIVIEESQTDFTKYISLQGATPKELIEESGIVGLGGAGFPTSVKLNLRFEGKGTVIINAAECEPILSHNIARIEKEPEKLLDGLAIIMKLVNAEKGIVAVKGIHKKAIEKLEKANADSRVSVHELDNIYPMGEERAIVRETLGILLEPEQLPMAADAVVINSETAFRIREAVEDKKPLMDKDMTVAGKLKENASIHVLLDVPLGMSVARVLEMSGGLGKEYGELIMGGPFTGKRTSLEAPIIKTTGAIIAAESFMPGPPKIGLLVCACGANKERLEEQASSMGSEVVGVEYCKQAKQVKNTRKCENPGKCPGQVQKVMELKKAGAQAVLISNCTDCSNTVMSCAPQLKLPVYHCTDGAMRAVNYKMIRRFRREE
ncbi:proline reductase-associated electron transfer protein PrdC [Clostridium sp. JS66]|uniref:proline reductase-associated electron transfer protein PrdC n=1 Tax=Clostridium sp. JS66 TaxID=3064705 RepID=UPI00298E14D2|nr:proline reductase-associated electron transfer protein PrdC [Clostridium sp. JS66]WPC41536.1 proline reductase-associated electron transfer protein PrdC [Clostridium sp. JS66]